MLKIVSVLGILCSLCGLGLVVRHGFTARSRLNFSGTVPEQEGTVSPEVLRQHKKDLKGRFGLLLVVVGVLLQMVSAGLIWAAG